MYTNKVGLVLLVEDLILMCILVEACTHSDDDDAESRAVTLLK